MKSLFTQFKEAVQDVQLSKTEKDRMREELISYMEYKPIRKTSTEQSKSSTAPLSLFPFFRVHHFTGAFLIATLALTSTFGVTFAADDALPGDLLYGVKVNFNEEIKSVLLSTSRESRIEWKKERAELRLIEASHLVAEGKLNDKNKEKITRLFAEHIDEMVEEVRAAGAEDLILAAEVSSDFEKSLETHEAVLARLIVEHEEIDESSRNLVEQVRTAEIEVEKMRENMETKITEGSSEDKDEVSPENEGEALPDNQDAESSEGKENEEAETTEPGDSGEMVESANMRIRAAQRAQVRAEELYQEVQEVAETLEAGSEVALQTEAQIQHGESKFEAGKQAFLEHEYGQAYNDFKQAATLFKKVVRLLEVANLFSIEIYTEPDEETLSDETETINMKRTETEKARNEAQDNIVSVQSLLLTQAGHSPEILEKAHRKIKDAGAYVLRGEIAMVLGQYDDAEYLFKRANSFATAVIAELDKKSKAEDVEDIKPQEIEDTAPQEGESSEEEESLPQEENEQLTLTYTYEEGIHSYAGTLETPTPCHDVEYTVAIAESSPEQVSVALTVTPPKQEGFECVQVVDTKEFTIEFSAGEHAKLVDVALDGESVAWEVIRQGEEESEPQEAVTETNQE